MGVPLGRPTVASVLALAASGGFLVGLGLCAVGGRGAQGWPDAAAWNGFLLLLASVFATFVTLFVFLLARFWALDARGSVAAILVLAVVGLAWARLRPDAFLAGIFGVAVLAAVPFAALQVWLWSRTRA